jgi:hypothetical protein
MISTESRQDFREKYKNSKGTFIQLEKKLAEYRSIDYEKLRDLALMSRHDTKFIFHIEKLLSIFDYLSDRYKIVEINKKRAPRYENLYYDTDDLLFYRQHHNQRVNRYKIRCRRYIDTDRCFFEIKCKNNKKKTSKIRSLLKETSLNFYLSEELKDYAKKNVLLADPVIDNIKPKLITAFNRITFANQINKERITFDINLLFSDTQNHINRINNLVIAELKQENYSFSSPVFKCFREFKIFSTRFSKYCIGTATMENKVKCNRFKSQLIALNKISKGDN